MDQKKPVSPPKWMGRSILSDEHHSDLETRAAINEFHSKMPRAQAEEEAHKSYVKEHRERAAAHHLQGMKAAMATANPEDARKHYAMYDLHMKALGKESVGAVPPEIEKRMLEEGGKPVYKFKAHKGDLYALEGHTEEPKKEEAPIAKAEKDCEEYEAEDGDECDSCGEKLKGGQKIYMPKSGLRNKYCSKPCANGEGRGKVGAFVDGVMKKGDVVEFPGEKKKPSKPGKCPKCTRGCANPNHGKTRCEPDQGPGHAFQECDNCGGTGTGPDNRPSAEVIPIKKAEKRGEKAKVRSITSAKPGYRYKPGKLDCMSCAHTFQPKHPDDSDSQFDCPKCGSSETYDSEEKAEMEPIAKGEAKQCAWKLGERRCKRLVSEKYCHDHVDHWANKIKSREDAKEAATEILKGLQGVIKNQLSKGDLVNFPKPKAPTTKAKLPRRGKNATPPAKTIGKIGPGGAALIHPVTKERKPLARDDHGSKVLNSSAPVPVSDDILNAKGRMSRAHLHMIDFYLDQRAKTNWDKISDEEREYHSQHLKRIHSRLQESIKAGKTEQTQQAMKTKGFSVVKSEDWSEEFKLIAKGDLVKFPGNAAPAVDQGKAAGVEPIERGHGIGYMRAQAEQEAHKQSNRTALGKLTTPGELPAVGTESLPPEQGAMHQFMERALKDPNFRAQHMKEHGLSEEQIRTQYPGYGAWARNKTARLAVSNPKPKLPRKPAAKPNLTVKKSEELEKGDLLKFPGNPAPAVDQGKPAPIAGAIGSKSAVKYTPAIPGRGQFPQGTKGKELPVRQVATPAPYPHGHTYSSISRDVGDVLSGPCGARALDDGEDFEATKQALADKFKVDPNVIHQELVNHQGRAMDDNEDLGHVTRQMSQHLRNHFGIPTPKLPRKPKPKK